MKRDTRTIDRVKFDHSWPYVEIYRDFAGKVMVYALAISPRQKIEIPPNEIEKVILLLKEAAS